jgi:hypothetical protein
MKRIIHILKERSGSGMVLGGFIIFAIFVVSLLCIEYAHLNIVSSGIRNAVQDAVTASCTENYARVYNGVREGYSGGYAISGSRWSENIDSGDVYGKLDCILGTRADDSGHAKYDGTKVAYSISDLSVQMTNAPFAPENSKSTNQLTGIAYVTLSVPMGFNWTGVPPMQVRLKVTAGYTPKF